jgi:hypothetical protein
MASSEAQKSEVHDSTADADGSPTAEGDSAVTRSAVYRAVEPEHPHRVPSPLTPGTHIVKDETDVGGPLIIESDDPDLSPPHVPIDPFPTDGTPEIDLPIERE